MMKYMLYSTFVVLIGLTIKQAFQQIKKDGYSYFNFLKEIYFKSFMAYIYAILIIFMVVCCAVVIVLNKEHFPSFLNWSWLSLFNEPSTNLITKPITESAHTGIFKPFLLGILFITGLLLLPILAYNEEVGFRSLNIEVKDIIKSSFIFSLIHFPMGVPIYALFILFIIGLLFSFLYIKKYNDHDFSSENVDEDIYLANKVSTMYVGRIHALYNVILISTSIIVMYLA